MATLNELAEDALRHLALLDGAETPEAEDQARALEALMRVVARLPEYGAGRALVDESVSVSPKETPQDVRLIVSVAGLTIPTPTDPDDGARFAVAPLAGAVSVTPKGRRLEGGLSALSISADTMWIYRADLADWVKSTSLTGQSQSPWPQDCDSALGQLAAEEVAPTLGIPVSADLGRLIEASRSFLRAKFGRPGRQDWSSIVPNSVSGPGRLRRYR